MKKMLIQSGIRLKFLEAVQKIKILLIILITFISLTYKLECELYYNKKPELIPQIGHTNGAIKITFSNKYKLLASGGMDKTIIIWDILSTKELKILTGHLSFIELLSFSKDDKFLASCDWIGDIFIWNWQNATKFHLDSNLKNINDINFSNKGIFFSAKIDDKVKVWKLIFDKDTNNMIFAKSLSKNAYITETFTDSMFIFWYDNKCDTIFFKGKNNSSIINSQIRAFTDKDTIILEDITSKKQNKLKPLIDKVNSFDIVNLNPYIFFSSCNKIFCFDLLSIKKTFVAASEFDINSMKIKSDENKILIDNIAVDYDNTFKNVIRIHNKDLYNEIYLNNQKVYGISDYNSLKFSPNGNYFAATHLNFFSYYSGGPSLGSGGIDLFSNKKREFLYSFNDSIGANCLDFSCDNNYLASSHLDGIIRIWDISSRKLKNIINLTSDAYVSLNMVYDLMPHFTDSVENDSNDIMKQIGEIGGFTVTKSLKDVQGDMIKGLYIGLFQNLLLKNPISYSPDGKYLACGTFYNKVLLYDANDYKIIHELGDHNNSINNIKFTQDSKFLLSSGLDGVIKIWDMSKKKELLSLISINSSDFLFATPDNYYTCSKGAYKAVAFRIGMHAYPFEQFDLRLNRPDIIMERLGFADSATIKKMKDAYYLRLHKMGFTQQQLDTTFHLPEIELKDKNWSFTTDKRAIRIDVVAKDSVYQLRQLNIYNNNVPIYGTKGIILTDKNMDSISIFGNHFYYFNTTISIPLIKGENKLQFSVLNEGGTESLYETRYVTCTDSSYKPHLYIVAIGVSDYPTESGLRKLGLATNDVDSISILFSNQRRFDKNRIHKILLKNEDATKDNILNIKKILMKTNPADEVIIQFSGHGVLDDSCQFRFANYDINEHNPESTGLNYDAMDNLVDGIPALKKVLFIDACHSGEDITKEDLAKIEEEDTPGKGYIRNTNKCYASAKDISDYLEQLFSDLRRGSGAIVISASRGSQSAFEHTKYSNGVFTHYVLEGIRKISEEKLEQDEDGTVKISELMNYILDSIEKSEFKDKQKPNFRRENIDNDFIIYQK